MKFLMRAVQKRKLALALMLLFVLPVSYLTVQSQRENRRDLLGGQTTIFNDTPNAFGQPAPGLERGQQLYFFVGNSFFNQHWVTAPASTKARDGLGPFFNAGS